MTKRLDRREVLHLLEALLHYPEDAWSEAAADLAEGDEEKKQRLLQLARYALDEDYFKALTNNDSELSFKVGDRVGVYELVGVLGHGGMGTVFEGHRVDGIVDQRVAIKFSLTELPQTLQNHFEHERRLLAKLQHPNVVMLLDAGLYKDRFPYLVMEFVDGVPIHQYIVNGKLSLNQTLDLFRQLGEAIAYCHQQLFIHGDVKPTNVLVMNGGRIKLLDFGLAKLIKEDSENAQIITATPEFASPEQLRNEPLDVRSDVFSFGQVIGYINRSTTMKPRIRQALDLISIKATDPEPDYRYNSINQVVSELDALSNDRPLKAMGGSWRYRFGLLLRRQWLLAFTISVSVTTLVVALITTLFLYNQTRDEADRAKQGLQQQLASLDRAREEMNRSIYRDRAFQQLGDIEEGQWEVKLLEICASTFGDDGIGDLVGLEQLEIYGIGWIKARVFHKATQVEMEVPPIDGFPRINGDIERSWQVMPQDAVTLYDSPGMNCMDITTSYFFEVNAKEYGYDNLADLLKNPFNRFRVMFRLDERDWLFADDELGSRAVNTSMSNADFCLGCFIQGFSGVAIPSRGDGIISGFSRAGSTLSVRYGIRPLHLLQ